MLRQLLARVPRGVRTGMGRGPAVMDRSPAEVPRKAALFFLLLLALAADNKFQIVVGYSRFV